MGRWYGEKKDVVENCLRLSIFELRQAGYFVSRYSGVITWTLSTGHQSVAAINIQQAGDGIRLRLRYSQTDELTGESQAFDYPIELDATACNYGDQRYWFLCPLTKDGVKCGRRVGVLYKGGDYFGCRHCYDLSYKSRNESVRFRGFPFRAYTIEDKIEKLHSRMKRKHYAGKPTRLYQRITTLKRGYTV